MISSKSRVEGFRLGFGEGNNGPGVLCASYEPNSFCWTNVTCHKYCESGSRECLAEGSLFQRGLRLGNLVQSGQNYLQAVLDRGHWDNTVSFFGVKKTGIGAVGVA